MRFAFRTLSLFSNNVFKMEQTQFENCARVLNRKYATALNQETLTGRILLYLNTDNEKQFNPPKDTTETLSNLNQNVRNLHKLNTKEIINFSNSLTNQNYIKKDKMLSILRELDLECYIRLSQLSVMDILKLLNVYMNLAPNRITEFKLYNHSILALYDSLHGLSNKDLLQLVFYIGLKKKNTQSQNMLRQCLRIMDSNFIDNLTTEELCIICNSTFKTSTKIINKKLLEKVKTFINDNLVIMKDPAVLVTLIKTIRHNRFQDSDLLNTISSTIFFNKTYQFYSFPAICHILALYGDYFYYDEKLFRFFTKKCIEELSVSTYIPKHIHVTEQIRGKDIKRLLWVSSMFSDFKLIDQNDMKNVIIPKLIERIQAKEFDKDIDSLIDITLYLWILNYRPYELIVPYVLTEKNTKLIGAKSNLRLNLLLYAIYLEDPDLLAQLPIKPLYVPNSVISSYQLHKRPLFQRLINLLEHISNQIDFNRFELTQEIPHLNIVGITGYKNNEKALYIEVLDDYNLVRNVDDEVPVGLMALKLRLLDRFKEGLLVISQKEVDDMTDSELSELLLDEIKLIC